MDVLETRFIQPRAVAKEAGNLRGLFRVLIFDRAGALADVPEGWVQSIDVTDSLNGGSRDATLVFARPYNSLGRLEYGYSVLIWIWSEANAMPEEPYFSGFITNFEQSQNDESGTVVVHCDGDFKMLDAAIVTSEITKGNDGTVLPPADQYLASVLLAYQPPGWGAPEIAPMFELLPAKFDGALLGSVVDTIVKQSRDAVGGLFIWYTRISGALERSVVIRPDANPTLYKPYVIMAGDYRGLKITTEYSDIVNTIAVYGGKNERTGHQVYGVFTDALSAEQYGARQEKVSVSYLMDNEAAMRYAETYFALHGFPTSVASIELLRPRPEIRAGAWVELRETPIYQNPGDPNETGVIKQMRVAEVKLHIEGGRIVQTLSTNSPAPFLDGALYNMGQQVSVTQTILNKPLALNKQVLYVRAGGEVHVVSYSPATVHVNACDAVYPTVGLVSLPPTTLEMRDTYNGREGDGDYLIFAEGTTQTIQIIAGDYPENDTMQYLAHISVVSGVPYIADRRTLIALPPLDISKQPSFAGGSQIYLPAPFGAGEVGAYQQQVVFQLDEKGSASTPGLSAVRLFTRPIGAVYYDDGDGKGKQTLLDANGAVVLAEVEQPLAGAVDGQPTRDAKYDLVIPAIGAGLSVAIYVAYVDTQNRISVPSFITNTDPNGLPRYISADELKEVADAANEAKEKANEAYDRAVLTELAPLERTIAQEMILPAYGGDNAGGWTAGTYYTLATYASNDEGAVITFAVRVERPGPGNAHFGLVINAEGKHRTPDSLDIQFYDSTAHPGYIDLAVYRWGLGQPNLLAYVNDVPYGIFSTGSFHTIQVVVRTGETGNSVRISVNIGGTERLACVDPWPARGQGYIGLVNFGAHTLLIQNFSIKTRGESYDGIASQIGDGLDRVPVGGSIIKEGQVGRPQIDSGGSSGGGGNLLYNPTGVKGIDGWTAYGHPHTHVVAFYTDPFQGGRFIVHDTYGENSWTFMQQYVTGLFPGYALCVSASMQANGCAGNAWIEITDPWGNILARSTQIVNDGAASVSVSAVAPTGVHPDTGGNAYVRCGTNTPRGQVVAYRTKLEYGTRPSPWTDDFADTISDKAHDKDGIVNWNNSPQGLKNRYSLTASCDGQMPYVVGNVLVQPSTIIFFRTNGTYCRWPPQQYYVAAWDYVFMQWASSAATPWIVIKSYGEPDFTAWATSPDWEIVGVINGDRGLRFEAAWVQAQHFAYVQSEIDEAGRYNAAQTQPGSQLPYWNNSPWMLDGIGGNGAYLGVNIVYGRGDNNGGTSVIYIPPTGTYKVYGSWFSTSNYGDVWFDIAGGNVWSAEGAGYDRGRRGGENPANTFFFYATGGQNVTIRFQFRATGSTPRSGEFATSMQTVRIG